MNGSVEVTWVLIIVARLKRGIIMTINKTLIPTIPPIIPTSTPFNDEITELIESNKLLAASDTLIKYNTLGGYWIISNKNRIAEIGHKVYDKQ